MRDNNGVAGIGIAAHGALKVGGGNGLGIVDSAAGIVLGSSLGGISSHLVPATIISAAGEHNADLHIAVIFAIFLFVAVILLVATASQQAQNHHKRQHKCYNFFHF